MQLDTATVAAELGEVLAGSHPRRTSDEQITIYRGVGLAFQDAVAAWHVYEQAINVDAAAQATIDWLAESVMCSDRPCECDQKRAGQLRRWHPRASCTTFRYAGAGRPGREMQAIKRRELLLNRAPTQPDRRK